MVRVGIVSLLFNWPSTGGGTVHSAEVGRILGRAGFDVRHFYARYAGWQVGEVRGEDQVQSQAIEFRDADWFPENIQRRFRTALDEFQPDAVIVTDSWNFKPLLAEAARGWVSDIPPAGAAGVPVPIEQCASLGPRGGRPGTGPADAKFTARLCLLPLKNLQRLR